MCNNPDLNVLRPMYHASHFAICIPLYPSNPIVGLIVVLYENGVGKGSEN